MTLTGRSLAHLSRRRPVDRAAERVENRGTPALHAEDAVAVKSSTFSSALVALLIVSAFVVMLLACGGGGNAPPTTTGTSETTQKPQGTVDAVEKPSPPEKKKGRLINIYAADEDLICATDAGFLDSSPLIAPARFVRVRKGTEVVQVGFGGLTSKLYWRLSAGGDAEIFVYDDFFQEKFSPVKTIDTGSDPDPPGRVRKPPENPGGEAKKEPPDNKPVKPSPPADPLPVPVPLEEREPAGEAETKDFISRYGKPTTETAKSGKRSLVYGPERIIVVFKLDRSRWKLVGYFDVLDTDAKSPLPLPEAARRLAKRDRKAGPD